MNSSLNASGSVRRLKSYMEKNGTSRLASTEGEEYDDDEEGNECLRMTKGFISQLFLVICKYPDE